MIKRSFNKICCLLLIALSFVFALTACTETEFKVDFIVDGVVYETITTSGQETIQMPNDPEKEGYIFDGWYRDKDTWKTSFTADSLLDEQLSANMSVYAKWKTVELSSDTQAEFDTFEKTGEYEYSLTVSNATETLSLETLVSVNALSSWTLSTDVDGTQTIAEKVATLAVGDNTYYVLVTAEDHSTQAYTLKIRRKALFDVVFDVAGGTSVEVQQVEEGGLATAPETTKKGYDFVTWNYDFTTPITENKTIVATWEIKEYTITYDLAGGSVATDNPTAYNVESGEIVLVNPTLEGCTFLGWTGTDISAPTTKVTIVTGSTGNREYVANWDFEATENDSEKQIVYDIDDANKPILETAPEGVSAVKAYLLNEEDSSLGEEITGKTLAGDTGVFKTEDAGVGAIKTLVYFDANNVAYPAKTRFVTKIIDNEEELIAALHWNSTSNKTVNAWGYHLLSCDITVSQPLTMKYSRTFKNGALDGDGHKITISTASTATDDKNFRRGLFGALTNVAVKNVQIELTMDFGSETSTEYQSLLAYSADAASSFKNVSMHLYRANGDVSANYFKSSKHYLYLINSSSATAQNVVVYVADDVFIPTAGNETAPLVVQGFNASTSWYVFSSKCSVNGTKYKLYASVASAISAGEKFLSLRESGYFKLNETNKTLAFGQTNEIYDAATGVVITQTEVAGAEEDKITSYAEFRAAAEAKYLVPGLNEGIVPQGMDVWEEKDLLFISGYFKYASDNTSGSPSSLLVSIDLKTGKHVGTYCLKNPDGTYSSSHAGGVAITGKNLFISSGSKLHRIPLSQIEKVGSVGTLNIVERINVPVKASFCNYSNGVLWVGDWLDPTKDPDTHEWQHMTNNDGGTYYAGAVGYTLKDTESEFSSENWDSSTMEYATPDYYLSITEKVQGFTFAGDKILLSKSQGTSVSYILVYDNVLNNQPDASVTLNGKQVPVWHLDSGVQTKQYNAMPMSEALAYYNGKVLILFESAAKSYNPSNRTDHVWSLTLPTENE